MIRISKKVEYALIALRYIANSENRLVTSNEISQKLELSRELTAKILQNLKGRGILISNQGIKGGYQLNVEPDEISLFDVIEIIDGKIALVECMDKKSDIECSLFKDCKIRGTIAKLQREFSKLLKSKKISDFI
jgi:Rrf2 family protein